MTESFDQAATSIAQQRTLSVLGCGNMGSAMVRALLSKGWEVTAWNRTPERTTVLAEAGATIAASPQEALTSTPLAILCVSTTQDARQLLDAVDPAQLAQTTILNTTSGTPADARTMRDWAQGAGVRYLDAAIGAYPEHLGTLDARLMVAGDEALWNVHRDAILDLAGSSMYVGADHAAANALDGALTGAFYITALTAYVEAVRFGMKFGVEHDVLADLTGYSLAVMDGQLKLILGRIRDQDFSTDQATLEVYADAAGTFAAGLAEHGDATMIQATAEVLRRAADAGYGDQDLAVVSTLG